MTIVTTTEARKKMADLIDRVKYTGETIGIGRRDSIDAVLVRFPKFYNKKVNDITNVNASSSSFDFLSDEPDIYSSADLKKRYV